MLAPDHDPRASRPAPAASPLGAAADARDTRALCARRRILRCALISASASVLVACGAVQLGQPAPVVPPEPGIDEIMRRDILAILDELTAEAQMASTVGVDTAILSSALPQIRRAFLTGAEREAEDDQAGAPRESSTAAPGQAGAEGSSSSRVASAPEALTALLTHLASLVGLCVITGRQCSGSLARLASSTAARATWTHERLRRALGKDAPAALAIPQVAEIVPQREVPATDLPDLDASDDLATRLGPAQEAEWYAAFANEILAARSTGNDFDRRQLAVAEGRQRGEDLALMARRTHGATVVEQEGIYPPPTRSDDLTAVERELVTELLTHHVGLSGALAAEDRAVSLRACLLLGHMLAATAPELTPLPGLDTSTATMSMTPTRRGRGH